MQLAEKKTQKDEASGNLADINKLLLSMNEARAKFAKNCDAASLMQIKKILSTPNSAAASTGREILDMICKFITNNINATYADDGANIFDSAENLQALIKRCDPSAPDKDWVRERADDVNMTLDGTKGKILKAVSNDTAAAEMHHFYNYYKVLFKFC